MRAVPTRAVVGALEAAGGAGCARFVGGCVRNALTGHPVADIDIATTLTPDEVIAALVAARLKAVPTGVDHGTITAVSGGKPFEITTLRRDVETDGRHAVVAFTEDWVEDARRRDFRLNALYADAEGRLYDPTGEGVADARAGRIVFVGDPKTRIREDALRILRFFRFLAWYGRGEPDGPSLAACGALARAGPAAFRRAGVQRGAQAPGRRRSSVRDAADGPDRGAADRPADAGGHAGSSAWSRSRPSTCSRPTPNSAWPRFCRATRST